MLNLSILILDWLAMYFENVFEIIFFAAVSYVHL